MTEPRPSGNLDDQFTRSRELWRRTLAEREAETAKRLLEAYERITPIIEQRANLLVRALAELARNGEPPNARQASELEEYTSLLGRISSEMNSFSRILGSEMATASDDAIISGIRVARGMTEIMSGDQASIILRGWNEPDPRAIANVVDYINNPFMRDRIASFAPNAVDSVSDLILTYVAQGKSPYALADRISDWSSIPYDWADNMARTVQVYSYRGATHESYRQNSRVVSGWAWGAALDNRTCISCWAMHGTEHGHDEYLNDHHRGRCTPIPMVRGLWSSMESGLSRFVWLDPKDQVAIMGQRKYDAWKSGEIRFEDLTTTYENDVYGTMRRVASLAEARRNNDPRR